MLPWTSSDITILGYNIETTLNTLLQIDWLLNQKKLTFEQSQAFIFSYNISSMLRAFITFIVT